MPRGFDERLQQHYLLAIACGKVLGNACCGQRQHFRGEVPHLDPGQQQKPRIVEHPAQMGLATGGIPTDPAVARRHLPGRRSEADGAQHPAIAVDQITQLRPRQRAVTQVVVPLDQSVPQARSTLLPHRLKAQSAQLPDRAFHRYGLGPVIRTAYQPPTIAVASARCRQLDEPGPMQPQQPHPGAHQLGPTQDVRPVQRPAYPSRDLRAQRRIRSHNLPANPL